MPGAAACCRPSGSRRSCVCGLDRDGGLAGVGGEGVAGGVPRAAVADLGQQLGGADHAVWLFEQRGEDGAVGVLTDGGSDLPLELLDLLVERRDRRHQAQDQRAADGQLELADPSLGSAAELRQQPRGLLPAGVVLADEERVQTRFSQTARIGGAGVALKERERDPASAVMRLVLLRRTIARAAAIPARAGLTVSVSSVMKAARSCAEVRGVVDELARIRVRDGGVNHE